MKMFNGKKKNTGSKADSEEVREYILECLGSGRIYIRKEIREYLQNEKNCSLSERVLKKSLKGLVCSKKICSPQRGYYIREEESSGKVFWMLWKCRRKLEAVLFIVRTDKVKCDVDIMRELWRMKRIVDSLMER